MNLFMVERYIDTKVCDDIVKEFDSKTAQWTNSTRGYWLVSSNDMYPLLMEQYKTQIQEVIGFYMETYADCFNGFAAMTMEEPFNIQKYTPGNHYSTWHCENNGHKAFEKRVLAFMTYLNDVEDGGETEFLYSNVKSKPKKGKTLVWPAYFTHTHRGLPAKTEEKYIVTGWVQFSPWKDVDLDESDEDFYQNLDLTTRITW